jgi:excisionase family DNA binding protein
MRCDNQWLTIPAAAKLLGRSNSAVLRAVERGSLPCQRIPGSHVKIAARVVAELLAASYKAAGSTAPLREPTPADATPKRLAEPAGA